MYLNISNYITHKPQDSLKATTFFNILFALTIPY